MQVKDGKERATRRSKVYTGSRKELVGLSRRGGERRRAVEASRPGRRPGGRLLCARARWGGDKQVQREREAASTGLIWGAIGDRSRGR